ncbi:hypothetical protein D3C71_1166400 [compost metagenome]
MSYLKEVSISYYTQITLRRYEPSVGVAAKKQQWSSGLTRKGKSKEMVTKLLLTMLKIDRVTLMSLYVGSIIYTMKSSIKNIRSEQIYE